MFTVVILHNNTRAPSVYQNLDETAKAFHVLSCGRFETLHVYRRGYNQPVESHGVLG